MSWTYQQVFAGEYNASTMTYGEQDIPSPPPILTPGGAICKNLFCAGALLERQGRKGEPMYARLADPTGAFTLFVDHTNTAVAGNLESMDIPCFATVVGEPRISGAGGEGEYSVRVREIREVDRFVRDAWVLRTADLTLRRIEDIYAALQREWNDARMEALITHYHLDVPRLRSIALLVKDAIRSVGSGESEVPKERDPASLILAIIREHGGKSGISLDEITKRAARHGMNAHEVGKAVEALLRDDECYQPARGVLKIL